MKEKVFRDPIFNYILISEDIIDNFIDTPIFQRLKNIEQTSYRVLFPSARHDRFTHSLGVYHLSTLTIDSILENLGNRKSDDQVTEWISEIELARGSFITAALMHDCAHSPFSHTLEENYNKDDKPRKYLFDECDLSDNFKKDYEGQFNPIKEPKTHEIVSSCVYMKRFSSIKSVSYCKENLYIDPELVVRMIIGCKYLDTGNIRNQIRNCMISLINGKSFDLDKFDYIMRDTWSLGVNNISIDVRRLLKSISINRHNDKLVVVFRESGIDIIRDFVLGKNILSERVTTHHIVEYFSKLLQKAVDNLVDILKEKVSASDSNVILNKLFSIESFLNPVCIDNNYIYLFNDGDIISILKKYAYNESEVGNKNLQAEFRSIVDELISRKPAMMPLWKHRVDYERIFNNISNSLKLDLPNKARDILYKRIAIPIEEMLITRINKPKTFEFSEDIHFEISNNVFSIDNKMFDDYFERTLKRKKLNKKHNYSCYVFINKKYKDKKQDCINILKNKKNYL